MFTYYTYDSLTLWDDPAVHNHIPEQFIQDYWVVAYLRAVLLMYHHRLPSPLIFFESQVAPGKSDLSLRMENRMVPVSPTGTRASLPKIEVMGTTYRTCDCILRS